MTSPAASSGQWWVIVTAPGAHGLPGQTEAAQKPFPPGSTVLSGPYATKAEAEAAASKPFPKGTPGGDLQIPNPFSWVGAVSHWIGDLVLSLTDVHMWISMAWIFLGIWLVIIGIYLWIRTSASYEAAQNAILKAI